MNSHVAYTEAKIDISILTFRGPERHIIIPYGEPTLGQPAKGSLLLPAFNSMSGNRGCIWGSQDTLYSIPIRTRNKDNFIGLWPT